MLTFRHPDLLALIPFAVLFVAAAALFGTRALSGVRRTAAAAVRTELGLDRPAWQQLGDWLLDVAQLDLGRSLVTSQPVSHELA
ncbi:MAG: hypothetical protein ACK44W_07285, partial [Planctomycetota bacterium]